LSVITCDSIFSGVQKKAFASVFPGKYRLDVSESYAASWQRALCGWNISFVNAQLQTSGFSLPVQPLQRREAGSPAFASLSHLSPRAVWLLPHERNGYLSLWNRYTSRYLIVGTEEIIGDLCTVELIPVPVFPWGPG